MTDTQKLLEEIEAMVNTITVDSVPFLEAYSKTAKRVMAQADAKIREQNALIKELVEDFRRIKTYIIPCAGNSMISENVIKVGLIATQALESAKKMGY